MSRWRNPFKKRQVVICAECIGYPIDIVNAPVTENDSLRLRSYPCQEISPIKNLNFFTGEISEIKVDCRVANAKGHCPYYVRVSPE
jgi:hypothetical protein